MSLAPTYVLGLMLALTETSSTANEVIVITGSRTEQTLGKAVIKTDVVTREAIEASGSRTLAEALEAQPGLRIVQDVTGASQIQLRGFGTDHVLVLVDGRRIPGKKNGAIDLARLGVEEVERIEVVRGPASSLYGADALAGVINIITRQPNEDFELSGLLTAGGRPSTAESTSPHTFTGTLRASGGVGDFSWRANAAHLRRSAFDLSPDSVGTSGSAVDDTDIDVSGRYDVERWRIDVRANGSFRRLTAVEGGPILPRGQQAVYDRTSKIDTFGIHVAPTVDIGAGSLRSELSFSTYSEVFSRDQRLTDNVTRQTLSDRLVQGLLAFDQIVGDHQLLVGTEFLFQDLDGERFPTFEDRTRISGFVQDDWSVLDSLTLSGGVRVDYDSQFDVAAAPRAALRLEPTPGLVVRGTWGLGFKAPLPRDLAILFENPGAGYRVAGNPNLSPERASTYSVDVSYSPIKRLSVSLGAFHSEIDDLIVALPGQPGPPGEPLLFTYGNVAQARLMGIEAALQAEPLPWLRLGLGYDGVDARDLETDEMLPDRAPHRVTGSLSLVLLPVRLDVQSAWTATRSVSADLDAPAYVRLDTRLSVYATDGITGAVAQFEFFLGADNLLDAGDPQLLVIAPRSLYAGLRGTWR